MTGRRRRRTRYEPVAPAAPVAPTPVVSDSTGPPATVDTRAPSPAPEPGGSLLAGPASLRLGPLVASPPAPAPAPAASPAPVAAPARARRHRLRAGLALAGFALLAFVTGLLLFNNLVMPRLIHGVGQVTVPDLTNLTLEQAEQVLRPLGLELTRAGERFDPSAPLGFVLAQEPGAGTSVRGRKHISVVVSLGEEYSSVPELAGESVRAARMLIDRAGLRLGHVVEAPFQDAGEGLVAGTDPGAEAVLQRSTRVHLLVSTGAGIESFVMPDLVGLEIAGVRRQLESLGFRIERVRARASVGTIVSQDPPAGSRITRATVIKLRSSGRMIR